MIAMPTPDDSITRWKRSCSGGMSGGALCKVTIVVRMPGLRV
jgi:hypothetical protein